MLKNLFVIDASGYLYRSYFAISNMTNDKGESTNALFGFVRSILKLFKDFNPQYCIAVFDGPDNSRTRSQIYSSYKAHRASMPPDLLYQIIWAKEFCHYFGISTLAVEGVEADDTMASIALWASNELEFHVRLCSSDKDLAQLVSDKVHMLDTFKENNELGSKEIEEKFGVPPSLIVDLLALIGDSSDNVPGIPGIGPKTAAQLLKQFGSLDALFEHLDQVPQKKRELFEKYKNEALLSRRLVTLDLEVEFPKEEAFFAIKTLQEQALKDFYASMRFNSLIRELKPAIPNEVLNQKTPLANYHLVQDEESLKSLIDHLSQFTEICLDTETSHTHPMLAELIGIGLGVQPGEAWYIPFNGRLSKEKIIDILKPFFENPKIHFFGHNLKYHYHVLFNTGISLNYLCFDTILASYLLNTHSKRHSLEDLSLECFGFVKTPLSSLTGKGKQQIALAKVPLEKVTAFCCEDVDYIVRLKNCLEPQLKQRGLDKLFFELELPILNVLAKMEKAGIYLDVPSLILFGEKLSQEIITISREIYELVGQEFNLNSPQQISEILFKKLKISPPKGTSTSQEVLEALKWEYPVAGKIQIYRGLEKLRSTYVEALPLQVNQKTHRIHCTFNQSVTATGRLSCQDPNLQNIPVKSEIGLRIREAFRPEKLYWSYVSGDYSQIELRLLAHLSEDPILISAFQGGEDIHRHTASAVFRVPIELVTKEMRDKAKAVNFGIIYGQGAYGLSQSIGISQKEAAQFIDLYFKQYPKVKAFLESCKDRARLTGKAVTITGRERVIPEILSKNIQIRNAAERLAVNTPFQGSAADIIKLAMLEIQKNVTAKNLKGFMILQIHDELIFEVPDEEVDIFYSLIKEKMETVVSLNVPLVVDITVGKNWKEC